MECMNGNLQWKEVDCRIRRWRSQRDTLKQKLETGATIAHIKPARSGLFPSTTLSRCLRKHAVSFAEIKHLCEQMVDYVSAGHFEMYSQLLQEGNRIEGRARRLIRSIYRRIASSTDQALNFNDKYDADEASVNAEESLPDDITRLCLAMKSRFDLEDQLIELLHESQRPDI